MKNRLMAASAVASVSWFVLLLIAAVILGWRGDYIETVINGWGYKNSSFVIAFCFGLYISLQLLAACFVLVDTYVRWAFAPKRRRYRRKFLA